MFVKNLSVGLCAAVLMVSWGACGAQSGGSQGGMGGGRGAAPPLVGSWSYNGAPGAEFQSQFVDPLPEDSPFPYGVIIFNGDTCMVRPQGGTPFRAVYAAEGEQFTLTSKARGLSAGFTYTLEDDVLTLFSGEQGMTYTKSQEQTPEVLQQELAEAEARYDVSQPLTAEQAAEIEGLFVLSGEGYYRIAMPNRRSMGFFGMATGWDPIDLLLERSIDPYEIISDEFGIEHPGYLPRDDAFAFANYKPLGLANDSLVYISSSSANFSVTLYEIPYYGYTCPEYLTDENFDLTLRHNSGGVMMTGVQFPTSISYQYLYGADNMSMESMVVLFENYLDEIPVSGYKGTQWEETTLRATLEYYAATGADAKMYRAEPEFTQNGYARLAVPYAGCFLVQIETPGHTSHHLVKAV